MAKVLIGIVTYGKHRYCLDEFQSCLERQTFKADHLFVVNHGESAYATLLKSRKLNAVEDPKPANNPAEKILNGRKYLREYALKNGYDYLLFLDSDIMLHPRALEALLATKADVVAGVYLRAFEIDGKTVIAPVLFKDLGNGECKLFTYEGAAVQKVIEVGAAGFGCTLVSKKVLQAVDLRSFGGKNSEAMAFYVDARAKGFKTVANTFVRCLHMPFPKGDPRLNLFEWRKNVEENTYTVELPK